MSSRTAKRSKRSRRPSTGILAEPEAGARTRSEKSKASSPACAPAKAVNGGNVEDILDIMCREAGQQALVAEQFSGIELSEQERQLGLEVLEIMARNVERQVREALSEHVRMSPFLPPAVASKLADDLGAEALPVIQNSALLSDQDLIAIVCRGSEDKQIAVAKRSHIAPEVADALVETGNERVVGTLLSNQRAEIHEQSLLKVLKEFGQSGDIQALIVERLALPLSLSEALISRVSEVLCERLVARHRLPRPMADELTMHGRERALTQMVTDDSRSSEIERLAVILHAKDALTPTLILRALCAGSLEFFKAAIAARAGMRSAEAEFLIFESGRGGLEEVYRRAALPDELFVAFRSAVNVINETRREERRYRPLEITERIMERLRQEYDSVCPEGLEHTLSQLSHFVVGRRETPVRGLG